MHRVPYGGPQLSRQNQKRHGKTENLTAKPKTSRQKQNTSRQNQKPHGKSKIPHGKTKNLTAKPNIACVAGAWKLWAKERTGAREGDTPRLACLLLARPFFLVPTTSKRLLRRLNQILHSKNKIALVLTWVFAFEVRYLVFAVKYLVLP